ncbi:uncharacterized protein LOC129925675 [Biomphalaria glabrata]|uniref:Uncharacterized protein LOC129925381 n=1 Tax=Biomphalaria glabrata TaxID=6526 RepID=A0A9W3A342_BIOGL|nr:uncharacterized protein LOC129925381 [Biomphalaria glabrata]XP_055881600.1 uncharacterized protein LOC129925675 [Biomphalaria glabrata]
MSGSDGSVKIKIVNRESACIKQIDKNVKNKFKWVWMEEKDCMGDFLSSYIRKLEDPGVAWCIICKEKIKYGSAGKKVIKIHATSKKHQSTRSTLKSSSSLPALFQNRKNLEQAVTEPIQTIYGLAPNVLQAQCSTLCNEPATAVYVSMKDRVSHQEALLCSFIAEHSLPLSIAPHLVALAQELSRDSKALSQLSMDRKSTSYKLRDGLSSVFHKRLVADMKRYPFSLNLDEATSQGSKQRILNILVSFFNKEESVVHLYASIHLTTVNATTVYNAVMQQFTKDDIPVSNLVSCLTDSASYMTGCKQGFLTKLKTIAPKLLDIDNDVCHHVHNIVKLFCQHFDKFVENLLDDLHTDFNFGSDLNSFLEDISLSLGKKYYRPKERVPHRWLSVLDCSVDLVDNLEPLTVFYYAWLKAEDKMAYNSVIINILKNISKDSRKNIYSILSSLRCKTLTPAGKARKVRIYEKLFFSRPKLDQLLNLYLGVLPLFKSFILLFESKEPRIHLLFDEQIQLIKNFLICFVKPETVRDFDFSKVADFDLDKDVFLNYSLLYTGQSKVNVSEMFLNQLLVAYKDCAKYMLQKFALKNKTLRLLRAINPGTVGHSQNMKMLCQLAEKMPFFNCEEVAAVQEEIRQIQIDSSLQSKDFAKDRIDHWWAIYFKSHPDQYPLFFKMISGCLSIFSGPRVESSFSFMNSLITKKTNRMVCQTYEAFQKVRYFLQSKHTTSLKLFHREDVATTPVDKALIFHVQTAWRRY